MGPLDVSYSLEDLLKELHLLGPESRPIYILALMLKDGFSSVAPYVPKEIRGDLEQLIRELAVSETITIVGWTSLDEPNVYRSMLAEWVVELDRVGWPPLRELRPSEKATLGE